MKAKRYFVKDAEHKIAGPATFVWQTKTKLCLALGNKWHTTGEGTVLTFNRQTSKQENGKMYFYCA